MKRYIKMFIVIFIIMTVADAIKYEIGLWAKTAFYGALVSLYAVLLFNNIVNDVEIDKKYHNHEIVKVYNRKIAKSLFMLGGASFIIAVILYFKGSVNWLLVLIPILLLLALYDRRCDREFWMQIPNEDRPKRYQDSPIEAPEENETSKWIY